MGRNRLEIGWDGVGWVGWAGVGWSGQRGLE